MSDAERCCLGVIIKDDPFLFFPNLTLFSFPAALIFDGTANPVHPNTIGSIDPHCQVGDVVQGKDRSTHFCPSSTSPPPLWSFVKPLMGQMLCCNLVIWQYSLSSCSDAFHSAKMLCDQYYLRSPDLELQEMSSKLTLIHSGGLIQTQFHPRGLCPRRTNRPLVCAYSWSVCM